MNELFPRYSLSFPRLGLSIALHLIALAILAWVLHFSRSGTTPTVHHRVGLAVSHTLPDRTRYVAPQERIPEPRPEDRPSDPAAARERAAEAPPAGLAAPLPLDDVLAEMLGEGPRRTATRPNASLSAEGVSGRLQLPDGKSLEDQPSEALVPGRARLGMGPGRTTTEVFGVQGTGSSFIYVFDHSESMKAAGSAPLRASKAELIRSLDSLTEHQQFQIIFYNDQANMFRPTGDATGLVLAEKGTIDRAKAFVRQAAAVGGTEHESALKLAIGMGADVIFFLTDAEIQTLSEAQIDEITRRAEKAGTVIHAIQFGTGPAPAQTFLQRLAKRNRGGYRYVDVLSMPR